MNNMNNSDRATRLHRALDRICDEGALSGISKGVGSAAQGAGSAVKGAGEGVGGVASGVGSAVKGAGHAIGHLLGGGEDRVPKPVALPGGAVVIIGLLTTVQLLNILHLVLKNIEHLGLRQGINFPSLDLAIKEL